MKFRIVGLSFCVSFLFIQNVQAEPGSYSDRGYSNSGGSKNHGNNPGNPNAGGYHGDYSGSKHNGSGIHGGDRRGSYSYGGSSGGYKNNGNNPGNPNARGYNGGFADVTRGNRSKSSSDDITGDVVGKVGKSGKYSGFYAARTYTNDPVYDNTTVVSAVVDVPVKNPLSLQYIGMLVGKYHLAKNPSLERVAVEIAAVVRGKTVYTRGAVYRSDKVNFYAASKDIEIETREIMGGLHGIGGDGGGGRANTGRNMR